MAKVRINQHGILCIDFRYHNKRHVLSSGLKETKPNRRVVDLKRKAIEHDIFNNTLDINKYFPQFKKSLSNVLDDFFQYYIKEKTLKPNSWRSLQWSWTHHIRPYFGHYKLDEITTHEVRVFKNLLLNDKKLANSTVSIILVQLAGILLRATQEGLITNYPMKGLGRLDLSSDKIDPFSFEELRHFLDFLKDNKPEFHDMIFIWSRCGFRVGEILALKWDDVDYYNSCISVSRTLIIDGSEGTPKTPSSRRSIKIRQEFIDALKRQESRSRMLCDYIFPDPITGNRYDRHTSFARTFRHLLTLARMKQRSPNQLRHTFATLHIGAGENISWVSRTLGHKDVKITLSRYNKLIPNLTHDDGSAFEKAFSKQRNGYPLVNPISNISE